MGKVKVIYFLNECLLAMGRRVLKYLKVKSDGLFHRPEWG